MAGAVAWIRKRGAPLTISPLLAVHATAGALGLLSGAAALISRKGDSVHRTAGTLFFAAMLVMATLGACLALFAHARITVMAAGLTLYLVVTGRATVRQQAAGLGIVQGLAMPIAVGVAAFGAVTVVAAWHDGVGQIDGQPIAAAYIFGGLSAFAVACDLRVIRKGSISGPSRLARHLWRMCTALLIAAFSFFIGQQKIMPLVLRGSPIMLAPEVAIIVALMFWLIRVRLAKAFARDTR